MRSHNGEEWLDLADAIALLRDQVAEAQRRIDAPGTAGDQGIRFGLGEITLELGMELARAQGAGGKLRFGVVGVEGERQSTRTATHRVTVRLDPRTADSSGVEVGDEE
ncbi:trypco2 family protein [Streptomyces sp. NPDC050617]|uniref:trypco2 family protein n=1 Tax=Streptomyces sp. NPDC050617 TaxID=3154628 RepID=UPI00341DFC97